MPMIHRDELTRQYFEGLREIDEQKLPDLEHVASVTNLLLGQIREILLDNRDLLDSIDRKVDD